MQLILINNSDRWCLGALIVRTSKYGEKGDLPPADQLAILVSVSGKGSGIVFRGYGHLVSLERMQNKNLDRSHLWKKQG